MGICSSCESTSVATAKLILQDGRLQEFSYPVKVSYVLQNYPTSFICNSDDMGFDDVVSAVSDRDELQLGQIYFALPLSQLKTPLHAEEMAALAVKASSALMKRGGDKCQCRRNPFPAEAVAGEEVVKALRRGSDGGGRGRRPNFSAKLSAIAE